MLRRIVLTGVVALVYAAPLYAEDGVTWGKEVRITGAVVRTSAEAVAVENTVGDVTLTCAVPARLAEKAAALRAGERVRMVCVRAKGRRAQLVKLELLVEKARSREKPAEKPAAERKEAVGAVVELGGAAIVVQGRARVACRVPEEKQAKLEGLELGDKVKIVCVGGMLAGLERYAAEKPDAEQPDAEKPAGEEARLYGRIAELSRASVTVRGEAGSLTCAVPEGFAEKLARFAVGDSVKMMCRGAELTYLEKV
ncbi:MAG: hypothetical protein ACYC1P_08700 [Gaiellaceae bacterium]